MYVDLEKLKDLHSRGEVFAHNEGPPPEVVIQLFETNHQIWRAELLGSPNQSGPPKFSIPFVEARERAGVHLSDQDLRNTITILGDYFYACDAIKIQAGQAFSGLRNNRPPLIFLWWD
jgi:hypothetical protein